MNSGQYIRNVLAKRAFQFYCKLYEECGIAIWQDDGATYHTSRACEKYRAYLGMDRLEWPAQFPDLNPI